MYLVEFYAEYYCQGYEWGWFQRSVNASSFDEACNKLKKLSTTDWEKGTPKYFKNLTI